MPPHHIDREACVPADDQPERVVSATCLGGGGDVGAATATAVEQSSQYNLSPHYATHDASVNSKSRYGYDRSWRSAYMYGTVTQRF